MKALIIPSKITSVFNINSDIDRALCLLEKYGATNTGFQHTRAGAVITCDNFPNSGAFQLEAARNGYYLQQTNQSPRGNGWRVQYRLVFAGVHNRAGFCGYAARIK